ncbi:MAG: glycosyltransferase [Oscillospiraceae bacterium]|jgi:glycosyltransferase involved in cell wall biosynthesis|nr:glycosyltransferase [Oscillospiraceae bacterium]
MITVSVIVPVYNALPYLDECVRSVAAQRFRDWELLLIDDGSDDGSAPCCDRWAAEWPERIRTVHQANAGVSAARNAGISLAQGKYLAFLDADDTLDPAFLEKMTAGTERAGAEMCLCEHANSGENPALPAGVLDRAAVRECLAPYMMRYAGGNSMCTKLFLREMVVGRGICLTVGLKYGEDREFVLRCLAVCERICYVPEGLYRYRDVPTSAVHAMRDIGAQLWEQYQSDVPLFLALGLPEAQVCASLRDGVAREIYHAVWWYGAGKNRRAGRRMLRMLLRSRAMALTLEAGAGAWCALREETPGRLPGLIQGLLRRRQAGLLALFFAFQRRRERRRAEKTEK